MRGYNCDEEIEVYGAANRVCSQASGNRHSGRRSLSEDRHLGGDVFQLEAQVFRLRNCRTQKIAAARRRKLQTQAGRRRTNARQADAAGCSQKKALRAKQRRQLVKKLIDEYRVSVRRACRICLTARSLYYFKLQGPRDDRVVRARIKEIAETERPLRHRPHPRSAATRRLAGQSQANTAHLFGRRLELKTPPPLTKQSGGASANAFAINRAQRMLEYGFCR